MPSDPRVTGASARRIIVFARVPRLGRVKTRLAAAIGERAALDVYERLLLRTLELVAAVPDCERELCIADDDVAGRCAGLAQRFAMSLGAQHGDDLGTRMAASLGQALSRGRLPVLIGTDCPALRPQDLLQAFEALARHDAVLGPTEDGGYVLVGTRRPLPGIFRGPRWGAGSVLEDTRRLLREEGASWHELRILWDLDDHDGLRRWASGHDGA